MDARRWWQHRSNSADDGCNNHVILEFQALFQDPKAREPFCWEEISQMDFRDFPFIHVTVDSFRNGISRLLLLARRIRVTLQVVGVFDPL